MVLLLVYSPFFFRMTKILNKHKNTRLVVPDMPLKCPVECSSDSQSIRDNENITIDIPVYIEVWGNQVPPVHCPSHQQSTTDEKKENSSSGMATSSDYVLGGSETKCSGSSSVEVRTYCMFLCKNIL